MAAISSCITMVKNPQTQFLSGSSLKPKDQRFFNISSTELSPGCFIRGNAKLTTHKMPFAVRAGGDDGRPNSASIFVAGFVLGGVIVGALSCVFAPQISNALAGADKKDLMRKLPKFIYDEEKALEKTRQVLTEKIAQLNSAIDDVSSQLRADEAPNGSAVNSEEIEASMKEKGDAGDVPPQRDGFHIKI